jgi:hypothetical protein
VARVEIASIDEVRGGHHEGRAHISDGSARRRFRGGRASGEDKGDRREKKSATRVVSHDSIVAPSIEHDAEEVEPLRNRDLVRVTFLAGM